MSESDSKHLPSAKAVEMAFEWVLKRHEFELDKVDLKKELQSTAEIIQEVFDSNIPISEDSVN